MKAELAHIGSDRRALAWTAGCVLASYTERVRLTTFVASPYFRWPMAFLLIGQAFVFSFATMVTIAYFSGSLGVAQLLGTMMPGDNYRRFVPLMEAAPVWMHVFWVASALLCMLAAALLVFNRVSAFAVFATAWLLSTVAEGASRALPEYRQVFSFAHANATRDYVIPVAAALVPLALALCLRVHGRCTQGSRFPDGEPRQ